MNNMSANKNDVDDDSDLDDEDRGTLVLKNASQFGRFF